MKTSDWGVIIKGSGRYLPGNPVSNSELIRVSGLSTTEEWISENLGIRQRHWAPEGIATSDIGAEASKLALADAKVDPKELDHILLCTSTSDWTSPAAASNVQRLIGADCPAEDKQTACSSFLFGLDHGARLIATGCDHVLVVGADVKSRFVRRDDLRLFPIFADGAGAVVLSKGKRGEGLQSSILWTDGSRLEHLLTPAGGSAMPATEETVRLGLHATRMNVDGRMIFDDAVEIMTNLAKKVCEESGLGPEDVDLLVPHQANLKIMKKVASNLGIPESKVTITIDHTGNIVAGTVPYALDFARKQGSVKPGNIILMICAGAGYSAAGAVYREPKD